MEKENSRCFSRLSCISSATPPAAEGQTVSDEEQVGLPSASPSTETVSKKEQVGLPSASSSTQTVSNLINAIREDAERVKPELDALIHKISGFFEVIETPKESQKETKRPISAGFSKSKDLLLETVRVICSRNDVLPAHEASQVTRDVVQGLNQVAQYVVQEVQRAYWVALCFLLVSYILDLFETPSNRDGCWSLLKQMYGLAVDIKKLTESEDLDQPGTESEELAQAGTELIVEGSLICCSRFFSTSVDKDELLRFEEKIIRRMPMWICSRLLCQKVRPRRPSEHEYPDHAVGIEEHINNVTKLLQWESDERAFMVIVHGFGGIGKTTLADTVFARYYVRDCKYSVVSLDAFPKIANSSTEIVKLQKHILKDLMRSTEGGTSEGTGDENTLDFDDFQDGRRKIGFLSKKEVAFLYIDNVLEPELLEKLLPTRTLKDAKKLRLLITTRDINVLDRCNIERGVHMMQTLSRAQAKDLLSKKLCNGPDDINGQITGSELENLAKISGGVPKLLEMMADLILSGPDQIRESCQRVIQESKLRGDAFSDIEKYIFDYEGLPEECKNPFLDICCFFEGWEWETVANIVGQSALDVLERRALVSNGNDMIRVHDVILTIGKAKARDTRFNFIRANADQIGVFFEQDMQYLESVKGLWFSDDEACKIPITKLNSMRNSLRVFGHKMQQEESFEKMELGGGQREPIFHELLVYKGESPHCPFKWSWLKKLRFLSYRPQNLEVLHKIPSKNLKHIELDGSLCSVSEILSSDIQQLRALQVLRLINFHNLEKLPEEWGEYLRENLKELTLSNCRAMKQLTGSISQLTGLQILKLHNCYNLKQWPTGCESLSSSLKKIILCNCPILKSLPSCFVEALDSDSRRLFQHEKGMLSDFPQSNSESERRLSPEQAKDLLRKEMCNVPDDINGQITDSELDKLVEISGGVPKILEMMAGFILSETDKIRESYDRVIEGSKGIRFSIMHSMLGYMEQESMDKVLEGVSPQASAAGNLDEQVGLPSASSSSETVRNIINTLREEAENSDLHAIIQRISELFDAIKTQKESQKMTERSKESQKNIDRPTSAGFLKLKDFLLEAVNSICSLKDVLPDHAQNKVARVVVQGLGQAHLVTSGFLLVVYFLERYETFSSNQEGCLSLLDEMYHLALDVQRLVGWKGLAEAERWDDLAKAGTELIVEGSLICCNQMSQTSSFWSFSTSVDKDDLSHFREEFAGFNQRMLRRLPTWICSSLFCRMARPLRPRENEYPDHAVGIEEPFNNVTKLLQWESEERAVAVIVHGFGGIGKSTLADAVFARYYVKDCKYSVVRLDSSPKIEKSEIVRWQKLILKDLMSGIEEGMRTSEGIEGDEALEFDDCISGRKKIGELLKKEEAFLYIDNLVDRDSLQELLPTKTLKDAKKLRVLITARDRDVLSGCKMKIKVHAMKTLPAHHGRTLLINEMYNNVTDGINGQITDSELEKTVEISCGIPQLLVTMGGFIQSETDKRKAYDTIMEDSKILTGNAFAHIDKYIFAYNHLPDEYKIPFLDICFFLRGWEWETVANIVGESVLDALEKRALVSKGKDMTVSLHDIIFKIAKEKAQDGEVKARYTRIDFTKATDDEIEEFFEKMQDMKFPESVKGLWLSDQPYNIPVKVLNSMHNSLRIFGHKMGLDEGQCENTFNKLLVYKGETPHSPFKWSLLKNIRFLSYRPQNLELLQEIPSSNLKHIELDGSLCSAREISLTDIKQLQALQVLRLINFHNLEKLPEEWSESLRKNLKELTLSHCTAMKRLPASISELTSLELLKLDNCWNLKRWPKGCESLSSSLKKIILWNCPILKSLPSCFVEALDSDSRLLFQEKGILSDSPQSDSDSDYESDED